MTNTTPIQDISQCPNCLCMTKTVKGKCGKCKEIKSTPIQETEEKYVGDYAKEMFKLKDDLQDITLHYADWACSYHKDGSITGGNTAKDYARSKSTPLEDMFAYDLEENNFTNICELGRLVNSIITYLKAK